jgi:hypothetical protein
LPGAAFFASFLRAIFFGQLSLGASAASAPHLLRTVFFGAASWPSSPRLSSRHFLRHGLRAPPWAAFFVAGLDSAAFFTEPFFGGNYRLRTARSVASGSRFNGGSFGLETAFFDCVSSPAFFGALSPRFAAASSRRPAPALALRDLPVPPDRSPGPDGSGFRFRLPDGYPSLRSARSGNRTADCRIVMPGIEMGTIRR